MLSMNGQFFKAVSTLPRDTYSPACSFTKSFFRSVKKQKKHHRSIGKILKNYSQSLDKAGSPTNYLQAAIRVELSDVPSTEPPLFILIHVEVL